jgi:SNF2 family DNA or RNA helicase
MDDWGNPLPYIQFLGPTPEWERNREQLIGGFTSIIDDSQLPYLNIPDTNDITLECALTPKQRKAYDAMEKEMLAWVDNGMDGLSEDSPLAVNAVIAKLMRLQQFAIGYMIYMGLDNKGKPIYEMSMPSAKLEIIKDFVQDTDEAFVIFSQFSQPLELLAKLMPDDVTLFTGKNRKDRDANLERFKAGNQKIIAMTYGAGGEGIDEMQHVCRNVLLIDRSWVPDVNNQAIGRIRRAGQTKPVNVIDVVSINTLDDERNAKIFTKGKINRKMLGLS